ncbi:hypothetical protein FB451DRAFT_760709 [Mycena latifolia]|nr:hypothetical protein FB451DRAFT_760709 [Mycena latifolia]
MLAPDRKPHSSRVRPQRPSSSEHRQLSVHASPYRRRERLGAPTRWSLASRPAELLQVLGTIPRLVRVLCAPSLAHAPLCMLPVDTTAPTLPNAEPIPESSSPASIPLHTLALALSYVGRLSRYHCMVRQTFFLADSSIMGRCARGLDNFGSQQGNRADDHAIPHSSYSLRVLGGFPPLYFLII